jgi:hypothetical protein
MKIASDEERRLRKRMTKLVGELADFGFDNWGCIRSLAWSGFCEWKGKKIREGAGSALMTTERKSIAFYTTEVATTKTIGEIMTLLHKFKASAILTEFNDDRSIKAISFKIKTKFGEMPFHLPANVEGEWAVLKRSANIPPKYKTPEQAKRVAWREVFHWLDAQVAIIESGQVVPEQIFFALRSRCPRSDGVRATARTSVCWALAG